jgi:hypothetical protein
MNGRDFSGSGIDPFTPFDAVQDRLRYRRTNGSIPNLMAVMLRRGNEDAAPRCGISHAFDPGQKTAIKTTAYTKPPECVPDRRQNPVPRNLPRFRKSLNWLDIHG